MPRHALAVALFALALAAASISSPALAAPTLSWSTPAPFDVANNPSAVSCASESLCVAVDHAGRVLSSSDPTAAQPAWSLIATDEGRALNAISCAAGGPCVAVDARGDALVSATAGSSGWSPPEPIGDSSLTGVSCASASLCVVVDEAGEALTSATPSSGGWSAAPIDAGHRLTGVSCSSQTQCVAVDDAGDALWSTDPTGGVAAWHSRKLSVAELVGVSCSAAGPCTAVDGVGDALASGDPFAPGATWSETPIDGEALTAVSCTPLGLCVAADGHGQALTGEAPTAPIPAWSPSNADSAGISGVSCQAGGFCLAVDSGGSSVVAAIPPPPSPPPSPPPPTPEALVHPQPSITGTPAVGQRLTCHPGTPSGTAARLTYAWVRDQIPIPEATASVYTVKGQDSGHHLQCQVTATDGGGSVTEKSVFVTIPVGGAPASVGETAVGKATYKSGKLSVPVLCSAQASGACEVMVRLAAVETLSGGRLVAVAARSQSDAHKSAADLRHLTVTLASVRVRLAVGAHQTVTATLNASAKRLLVSRRHFTAYIYVSGTVIGVIEAQLAQQLITLASSAHAASARTVALAASAQPTSVHPDASALTAGDRASAASVLAATPYMGWDTYFALGGNYSEATVLRQASQLISLGLRQRGYRYVWLDVGWWHGTRAANGQITVSPKQWPHGLAWLTSTLHAAGLLVGLYTDAGPNGCGGAGQGSYGHYQQDVNTLAAWGFDAVKVDFCGGAEYGLNPAAAYTAFHAAIAANSSHRSMLLSICNFLQPEQYGDGLPPVSESAFSSYSFGPSVGNSWRTDTDVGFPGNVPFADVLRNMDADAADPQAAGPGHWNDPDYLAPDQGMSATQFQTQFSMWTMLAAPLMISDNLTKIGPSSLAAVKNAEAIAIDQDPAGAQATLLATSGNGQVWVKPLVGGSRAVALLNRGTSTVRITTSASAVGMSPASSYTLRNLWTHGTSSTSGSVSAEVPGDSTVLLRVSVR